MTTDNMTDRQREYAEARKEAYAAAHELYKTSRQAHREMASLPASEITKATGYQPGTAEFQRELARRYRDRAVAVKSEPLARFKAESGVKKPEDIPKIDAEILTEKQLAGPAPEKPVTKTEQRPASMQQPGESYALYLRRTGKVEGPQRPGESYSNYLYRKKMNEQKEALKKLEDTRYADVMGGAWYNTSTGKTISDKQYRALGSSAERDKYVKNTGFATDRIKTEGYTFEGLAEYLRNNKDGEKTIRTANFENPDKLIKELKEYNKNLKESKTTYWQNIVTGEKISEAQYKSFGDKAERDLYRLSTETGRGSKYQKGIEIAAEILVPGLYVAKNWKQLTPGEKAFNIAIDAMIFSGVLKGAMRGARLVGTTGKLERLGEAGRYGIREVKAMAVAPLNVIIHPGETIRAVGRDVRELAENLANTRKIPEAVITTSHGTIRLKVSQATNPAEAKAISDSLVDLSAKGEKAIIQVGDQIIELPKSPLIKEAKGGLVHTTPSGESFVDGLKVAEKPGMPPSEQGLFVSPEPLPKFTKSSAFGIGGETPVIYITSRETAEKAVSTAKIYDSPIGKVAEMEKKFLVGETLAPPAQKLYTRLGPEGYKVEIWLEKPLSKMQIAKLKAQGWVETVKAIWKEPLKIKGKGKVSGLSEKELTEIEKVLKSSGNTTQAKQLTRLERVAGDYKRAAAPSITITARADAADIVRARDNIGLTDEYIRIISDSNKRAEKARDRTTDKKRAESLKVEAGRLSREANKVKKSNPRLAERLKQESRKLTTEAHLLLRGGGRSTTSTTARIISRITTDTPPPRTPTRKPTDTPPPRTPTRKPTDTPPPRTPVKKKLPKDADDKKKRKYIKDSNGAIGWRQGEVGGKDRWDVIVNPYQSNEDYVMVLGAKPKGAVVFVKGPGSARQTTQMLYGKPPGRKVTVDSGFQDVTITPNGKKISLDFTPDPKLETKGDITIGGKTPRISPKMPRLR